MNTNKTNTFVEFCIKGSKRMCISVRSKLTSSNLSWIIIFQETEKKSKHGYILLPKCTNITAHEARMGHVRTDSKWYTTQQVMILHAMAIQEMSARYSIGHITA